VLLACWLAGCRRSAVVADPYVALHHQVGRAADQKQVLDIVAAHQHQPPVAIHRRGVHHRQSRLPVASARHEGAERHASDDLQDNQQDNE
jgi:hypothetical protein